MEIGRPPCANSRTMRELQTQIRKGSQEDMEEVLGREHAMHAAIRKFVAISRPKVHLAPTVNVEMLPVSPKCGTGERSGRPFFAGKLRSAVG